MILVINDYIKITTYNFKILFFRGFMKKSLRNKIIVLSVLIVVILALDLVTKYVFDGMYEEGTGVSLGIFNLIIVHNHGAAWGIFSGNQVGLVILSVAILAFFIWYYVADKKKSWLLTVTFAFLCAGCVGNLYDRLVFGYVRDFIQFAFWQSFPVFNFADVFLTFGVIMFAIHLIIFLCKKEKAPAVNDPVGKITIEEPSEQGVSKKSSERVVDLEEKTGEKSENLSSSNTKNAEGEEIAVKASDTKKNEFKERSLNKNVDVTSDKRKKIDE